MSQILGYIIALITGFTLAAFFYRKSNKASTDTSAETSRADLDDIEFKDDKIGVVENIEEENSKDVANAIAESEKIKTRFENLQVVNELGQHVTSSLDLKDTFQHLYETINSIMDAAVFELGIYNWRDSKWMIISNVRNPDELYFEETYHNHLAEWSLKNHREVFLEDATKDYERYVFEPLELPNGEKPNSIMTFPVLRKEKEVGTISVMSFQKSAFNDYHIEMIRSLLPYTAVAIGNSLIHKELIETQDQLIHNEKMASLGQIASGIAHEILNPLNFVNNFSEMSKEILPEIENATSSEEQTELKGQLLTNLDKIQQHGQRAYSIVKNMLLLSRRNGKGKKSDVNIENSIREFADIAITGFKNKVSDFECTLKLDVHESLNSINIIAEDFGSVILNLVNNACYTMNEKLKKISDMDNKSGLVEYTPELSISATSQNSMLVMEIKDNGMGIPDEIRDKIFLPFFTTKPPGEGTGLGLSISHDIIFKGNKGQINVESDINKGSNFKVIIPLNSAS